MFTALNHLFGADLLLRNHAPAQWAGLKNFAPLNCKEILPICL